MVRARSQVDPLPAAGTGMGLSELPVAGFIKLTSWPSIDLIPSCANAAFVEFASAQYRHLNSEWSFFAADVLFIPSGPGYWGYDSTTSFISQLSEAIEDLGRFKGQTPGNTGGDKAFLDLKFLPTRFEPNNDLHRAMQSAFGQVFKSHVAEHPIEMTRAVEQSGRFLSSVNEID